VWPWNSHSRKDKSRTRGICFLLSRANQFRPAADSSVSLGATSRDKGRNLITRILSADLFDPAHLTCLQPDLDSVRVVG
jgi:hypothetical protein